jgi:hypothetical protein
MLAVAALALFVAPLRADAQVGITINGNAVNVQPEPIVQAGRVFVPLRGVFEQLGASVVYSSGQINATGNGRNISLQIGSTQATVDGQPATIDVAPFIVGESTYVPLRFISESLGAGVSWDDSTNTVSISMAGAPAGNDNAESFIPPPDDGSEYADAPPPPIPDYDQPPVTDPNDIWQPGYWQWGNAGYYWVPGTWVAPPQPGYLWTPGYWHAANNRFAWVAGFWAVTVGFYGGVNYGGGYFGHGYDGGRWSHDQFQYNTYVTHVDTSHVTNVYEDRNVTVNASTHVSYNGGPHGIQAQPTSQEQQVAHDRRIPMTTVQRQHVQAAATDRRMLASYNHEQPPVTAVAKPLSPASHPEGYVPVTPADRVAPPASRPAAAVNHPAPSAYHAPAPAQPAYHAPAPAKPAYHAPAAAPVYHAPPAAARPAPPAAVTRPAPPAYHAPAAAPPAYHPAPPHPGPPPPHQAPPAKPAPQEHPKEKHDDHG